jgi:hypothetical protein
MVSDFRFAQVKLLPKGCARWKSSLARIALPSPVPLVDILEESAQLAGQPAM